MSVDPKRFLELYEEHRLRDQLIWYRRRVAEFWLARRQIAYLTAALFMLSSLFGFLATADPTRRGWWSMFAVVVPVAATALASYEGLYGFERQENLYSDAMDALDRVSLESPSRRSPSSGPELEVELAEFVSKVEAIFRSEQGQWGQLLAEKPTRPADPSA